MAGYSGTPLAKKLGIKAAHRLALINAPEGFEGELAGLAEDVVLLRTLFGGSKFDVIVLFVDRLAELNRSFSSTAKRLVENGGLWVAWPKRSSGATTDLDENKVRDIGLGEGLVDNKVCAINEIWSGLRFLVRLADRSGAPKVKKQ